MTKFEVLVLAVTLGFVACGGSSGMDALLEQVETAYGGPEALAKMQAYRVVGRLTKMQQRGEGLIRRDYRSPDSLRVDIVYATHRELRMLDGSRGWRGDGPGMRPAEGPLYDSMVYQLLRSDLPGALLRNRDRLIDEGLQDREGASYRVLLLPWSETLEMRYWLDPSTARVIRAEGVIDAGPMRLDFAAEYGDFRIVEGVLIPFLEANFASGTRVATTTIDSVYFAPPDLGPFVPGGPAGADTEV